MSASEIIDTTVYHAGLSASKSSAEFHKLGRFDVSARGRRSHGPSESERGLRVGAADLVGGSDGHKSESGANGCARVLKFQESRAACGFTGDAEAGKGGGGDRGADGGSLRSGKGVRPRIVFRLLERS